MPTKITAKIDRVEKGKSPHFEIVFTDRFHKKLRCGWPPQVLAAFNQIIRKIAENPYKPWSGIQKLAGQKNLYRIQFASWRLTYSLTPKNKLMTVQNIGLRGAVYNKNELEDVIAIADEVKTLKILKLLSEVDGRGPVPADVLLGDDKDPGTLESSIQWLPEFDAAPEDIPADCASEVDSLLEPMGVNLGHPLISCSELLAEMLIDPKVDWLLNHHKVDLRIKADLQSCKTYEEFEAVSIPDSLRDAVEDLMTGNKRDGSDIERLYRLGDADFGTLAARPLHSFLLHLDEAQQEIVNKPLSIGPFLVKGSAGTGKTIVCLYRLQRMVLERMNETLFDKPKPVYLFVSFTNALVAGAKNLYNSMMQNSEFQPPQVEFITVEKLIYWLRREHSLGKFPAIPEIFRNRRRGLPMELLKGICLAHPDWKKFSKTWSLEFLMHEFDHVIYGNDLKSINDYLNFDRQSQEAERLGKIQKSLIWDLFTRFHEACLAANGLTFEGARREVLHRLEEKEFTPSTTYSHIFIDEVQDLPDTVLRLLRLLVAQKEQLTLASDVGQSIYRRSTSLGRAHSDLRFNRATSHELLRSYRMSAEIQRAIAPLRISENVSDPQPEAIFSGPMPNLLWCPPTAMAITTANLIQSIHDNMGVPLGSIAIVLRANPKSDDPLFVALKALGVAYTVFGPRNRDLELGAEKVHIITAHSIKGLEFPHIVLSNVSANTFPSEFALRIAKSEGEKLETLDSERRLLYVACSRAMHTLWIIADSSEKCPYLNELDMGLWNTTVI
jgi:superfamily I DNA/RNA helicase/mRNA-degrading endonuclease RelE of RelBE toxin-antitoxin system